MPGRSPMREAAALALGRAAYAVFYLTVAAAFVGVPLALVVCLVRALGG